MKHIWKYTLPLTLPTAYCIYKANCSTVSKKEDVPHLFSTRFGTVNDNGTPPSDLGTHCARREWDMHIVTLPQLHGRTACHIWLHTLLWKIKQWSESRMTTHHPLFSGHVFSISWCMWGGNLHYYLFPCELAACSLLVINITCNRQ